MTECLAVIVVASSVELRPLRHGAWPGASHEPVVVAVTAIVPTELTASATLRQVERQDDQGERPGDAGDYGDRVTR